jgi:hypothetical protein
LAAIGKMAAKRQRTPSPSNKSDPNSGSSSSSSSATKKSCQSETKNKTAETTNSATLVAAVDDEYESEWSNAETEAAMEFVLEGELGDQPEQQQIDKIPSLPAPAVDASGGLVK